MKKILVLTVIATAFVGAPAFAKGQGIGIGANVLTGRGGVTAGLITAVALTRLLSTQLFGITPTDPATFGVVAIVLAIVALAATAAPAHRAASVDPILTLRSE
jgi:ABC-type lipoprotein release transport system permease subunit